MFEERLRAAAHHMILPGGEGMARSRALVPQLMAFRREALCLVWLVL